MSNYKNILEGLLKLLVDQDGDSPYGLYNIYENTSFLDSFFEAADNGCINGIESGVDVAEYEAYAINYLKNHGLSESDLQIVHTGRDHEGGFTVVVSLKNEYFKFDGYYDSYEGADLNITNVKQCAPKQVEITVYENIE